jgi:putative IMPACT (imprinted ancient) family translation regulator
MNPITDPAAPSPDPRQWSARLGVLAAQNAALPIPRSRFLAILNQIRQRNQSRESLAAKVHATHFIMGD